MTVSTVSVATRVLENALQSMGRKYALVREQSCMVEAIIRLVTWGPLLTHMHDF